MRLDEYFKDWEDVVEYDAGIVIFSERDRADVMYVVLSGEVEMTLRGEPLGAEMEGGMLGEMGVITSGTRSATVTALRKVKLARISQEQFRDLVEKNTDFAFHVMAVLTNRLRSLNIHYTALLR